MKFRFRLAPLLKVARRNLVAVQNELSTLQQERANVELEIGRQEEIRGTEDLLLSSLRGSVEAKLFFHQREAQKNAIKILNERVKEYLRVEAEIQNRLTTIKHEIYRLEKLHDQAKEKFLISLRKEEDKELDEVAVLRHRRS